MKKKIKEEMNENNYNKYKYNNIIIIKKFLSQNENFKNFKNDHLNDLKFFFYFSINKNKKIIKHA